VVLLDDLLVGTVRGLLKPYRTLSAWENIKLAVWKSCRLSLRIWQGLFLGSPLLMLSRLIWEQPQTLLGFLVAHWSNLFRRIDAVTYRENTVLLEGSGYKGSISFGTFILLYPKHGPKEDDLLWRHEFGHTLQSRLSGPLFLFKYGIPSLLTGNEAWMEQDANLRAARFFDQKDFPFATWASQRDYPMNTHLVQPKWYEYVLLFSGIGLVLLPWLNKKHPL
jgi:hypothetical protein